MDDEGLISLMEQLRPHTNLKWLELKGYHAEKMLGWTTLLPNLVKLRLFDCRELEYLPWLGNLRHLKFLDLIKMEKLVYVEDIPSANVGSTPMPGLGRSEDLSFFPSLEHLWLENLPNLKGWRRGLVEVGDDHLHQISLDDSNNKAQLQLLPCFSQLKGLLICSCPELRCILPCPRVENLYFLKFNRGLQIMKNGKKDAKVVDTPPSYALASCHDIDSPTSSSLQLFDLENGKRCVPVPKLRKVYQIDVSWVNLLPTDAFQCLESLDITTDKEVESLGEVEKVFCSCSSSLRCLNISHCLKLRSVVPRGLEHLTVLEELVLDSCENLRLSEEEKREDTIDMHWQSLHHTLRSIDLFHLPQLVILPNWMQFLPTLQSL